MSDYGRVKGPEDKAGLRRRNPNAAGPSTAQRQLAPAHPILRLQRQVGNSAVARMLAQRESEGPEAEEEEVQAKFDGSIQRESEGPESEEEEVQAKFDGAIQRESEGGEGEDEEMQAKFDTSVQRESEGGEAEDEEVQAKFDGSIQRESEGGEGEDEELQAKHDLSVQRESEGGEAEDEEVQMKPEVGLEGGPVGAGVAAQIQTLRGGGEALDSDTRGEMEGHFGSKLDDVRVHTGSESSNLNHKLGALAFTTGSDIFMRDDAYKAGTDEGKKLLSHELTHVVQQRSMPSSGQGMRVGPAGDSYEQAADAKAAEVMSAPATAGAQRKEDD